MPVRAVCKPLSPDLKRGALATDAAGCSLWRYLLERPPPAPESRVRDPLGARSSEDGLDLGGRGRAETFGGAGAQNIKGHMKQALNRAVHKIS